MTIEQARAVARAFSQEADVYGIRAWVNSGPESDGPSVSIRNRHGLEFTIDAVWPDWESRVPRLARMLADRQGSVVTQGAL